ncbi:hypothetical protein B0H14DRAFT_2571836 [Mycena olivaceomarginata]|nr:hypothetical protein B0H14DRAFT_2571836 [Mycena olivaceomarginata]
MNISHNILALRDSQEVVGERIDVLPSASPSSIWEFDAAWGALSRLTPICRIIPILQPFKPAEISVQALLNQGVNGCLVTDLTFFSQFWTPVFPMYEGLKADFEDDDELLDGLETAKHKLETHFRRHYSDKVPTPSVRPTVCPSPIHLAYSGFS